MDAKAIMQHCNTGKARSVVRGFSAVEILIVVIILGTLAALVIPQFSSAGTDARNGLLVSQLQSIREQIGYYQLQHNGKLPRLVTGGGWSLLTQYTSVDGEISPTGGAGTDHPFGPYLRAIPSNPLVEPSVATHISSDASKACGWVYNESNGKICGTASAPHQYFNEVDGSDSLTNAVQ